MCKPVSISLKKNTATGNPSKAKDVLTVAVLKLNKRDAGKQWASHQIRSLPLGKSARTFTQRQFFKLQRWHAGVCRKGLAAEIAKYSNRRAYSPSVPGGA